MSTLFVYNYEKNFKNENKILRQLFDKKIKVNSLHKKDKIKEGYKKRKAIANAIRGFDARLLSRC